MRYRKGGEITPTLEIWMNGWYVWMYDSQIFCLRSFRKLRRKMEGLTLAYETKAFEDASSDYPLTFE